MCSLYCRTIHHNLSFSATRVPGTKYQVHISITLINIPSHPIVFYPPISISLDSKPNHKIQTSVQQVPEVTVWKCRSGGQLPHVRFVLYNFVFTRSLTLADETAELELGFEFGFSFRFGVGVGVWFGVGVRY